MKKILEFFKLRYITIYFFLYSMVDYFFNGKLKALGVFDILQNYLGVVAIPLLLCFIISLVTSPYMDNRTKKMLLSVRVHCFFILSLCCLYLFIMYKLELPLKKELADTAIIEKFLQLSIYKYKIGFISTYIFYLLLTKVIYLYLYIGLGILIFSTTFLITVRPVKMTIKKLYHNYKEKKRIEYEQKLLSEQIAIKEALEKREILMREKMEQERENKIKERVEEVLAKKEIVLESFSLEDNNIDKENTKSEPKKEQPEKMVSDMAFETPTEFKIFTVNGKEETQEKKDEKEVKTEERKLLTIRELNREKGEKNDTGI